MAKYKYKLSLLEFAWQDFYLYYRFDNIDISIYDLPDFWFIEMLAKYRYELSPFWFDWPDLVCLLVWKIVFVFLPEWVWIGISLNIRIWKFWSESWRNCKTGALRILIALIRSLRSHGHKTRMPFIENNFTELAGIRW